VDDDYTEDMDAFICSNYITNLMSTMPKVDSYNVGSAIARGSTNMGKWMMNPSDFIRARYDNVELWRLPPEVFGERFTILYNTVWQSTYGTRALGGNLPENVTETGRLVGESYGSNITFNASEAIVLRQTRPVYKTN
jgi:hypothetical protein